MALDELFAAPSDEMKLATELSRISGLWRQSKPKAIVLGNCGCSCTLSPVTIADFESAVIFHIDSLNPDLRLSSIHTIDELLSAIYRSTVVEIDEKLDLLKDLRTMIVSFLSQCSSIVLDTD